MEWPNWWEWELEVSSHVEKRMEQRNFTELDLREMLESARSWREDVVEGRYVVETKHRGGPWEVVVEPDPAERLLVVITALSFREVKLMHDRYLEVTFRKGKPLAAYLYLPRKSGAKSARTEKFAEGLLVDYAQNGQAIGIEITAPGLITATEINRVLEKLGETQIAPDEFPPLAAA